MSNSRGSTLRTRPQKHQNRTAFKNDLHDTSKKTKAINSMDISGVCKRCKDIIEWKIKYKKYKPLTAPRKCVGCEQKTVKHAYHMLCRKCASDKNVCAKCIISADELIEEQPTVHEDKDIESILKDLPERKRRTILRHMKKQEDTPEVIKKVEEMVTKMGKVRFDSGDDDFFGEDFCDSSSGDELQ